MSYHKWRPFSQYQRVNESCQKWIKITSIDVYFLVWIDAENMLLQFHVWRYQSRFSAYNGQSHMWREPRLWYQVLYHLKMEYSYQLLVVDTILPTVQEMYKLRYCILYAYHSKKAFP